MNEKKDLYQKYRPKKFKDMYGQDATIKRIQSLLAKGKFPNAVLFTGESGVGKTTLARIIKVKLKAQADYHEYNAAESRGIETIRDVVAASKPTPMYGPRRLFVFDEAHCLTGDAQSALLKLLEDSPEYNYFILCTTHAIKLIPTIKTRVTEYKICGLDEEAMTALIVDVAGKEKIPSKRLTEEVITKICSVAGASARKALVILHQIADLESSEEMLDAIEKSDVSAVGFAIAKALMNPKCRFVDLQPILQNLEENPETVRIIVMNTFGSILKKNEKAGYLKHVARIMNLFQDPLYDGAAKSTLALRCYEACEGL